MPRYYFDVDDGDSLVDEAGVSLWGDEAARREAYGIIAKYASNPINLMMDGSPVVTIREGSSAVSVIRFVCQESEHRPLQNRSKDSTGDP